MTDLIRKQASSTTGGELTDGAQTVSGDKTFTGNISSNNLFTDSGSFNYTESDGVDWEGEWVQVGRQVTVSFGMVPNSLVGTSYTSQIANNGLPAPSRTFSSRGGTIQAGSLGFPTATLVVTPTTLVMQKRLDNGGSSAVNVSNDAGALNCVISYIVD